MKTQKTPPEDTKKVPLISEMRHPGVTCNIQSRKTASIVSMTGGSFAENLHTPNLVNVRNNATPV